MFETRQAPELDPRVARSARLFAGLTQREVAERIGRTQAYYSLWERGRRSLRADELRLLTKILGIDIGGGAS